MGDDVGTLKNSAVIAFQVGLLQLYVTAVLAELVGNPLGTTLVRLTIHGTWAEVTLLLTKEKSRVGIELDGNCLLLLTRTLLGRATGAEQGHQRSDNYYILHVSLILCTSFITRRKLPPHSF